MKISDLIPALAVMVVATFACIAGMCIGQYATRVKAAQAGVGYWQCDPVKGGDAQFYFTNRVDIRK